MGEVIENKVVQMAFDNTKFEKGVQATLNILGRLNNAITGLNTIKFNILGLADQVKAVTFDPINTQLQIGVGKAMALTAALTGVYNITDQIYNTMVGTIRSMTFDQVMNGWNRYEQLVNSTQTILASTRKEGESMESAMERVSEVQEKLMWFADETSYDAQAMLETISQFTSHGVELEEASTAMEGIANWAATAGVNATNATYAMQQLAQTIGKGYVQNQDWVSIQSRNMDTTKFKELIIDAAVARGELKKVGNEIRTIDGTMDVSTANMEKSLSKKWFTKDVLMDVLRKYGEANEIIRKVQEELGPGTLVSDAIEEAKSRAEYAEYMLSIEAFEMGQVARTWTDALGSIQTATATKLSGIFKIIFGDYLEAKDLWTDISEKLYDIFITPLDNLLQAFQKWGDPNGMKGSQRLWESFWKIFTAIEDTVTSIWTIISKTFGIIANEKDEIEDYTQRASGWVSLMVGWLDKATSKIEQFAQNFKMFFVNIRNNEKIMKNIESFFNGVKIGLDLITKLADTFKKRVIDPIFDKSNKGIETVTGLGVSFENLMKDIQTLVDETDLFNQVFDTTELILGKIIDGVVKLIDTITGLFNDTEKLHQGKDGSGGIFSDIADEVTKAGSPIEKFGILFGKVIDSIGYGVEHLVPLSQNIGQVILNIFGGIGTLFTSLAPAFKTVGDTIKYIFDTIVGAISSTGGKIGNTFEQMGSGIAILINNVARGNVDNFKKFLEVIHNEVAFYKDLLFGGMTIPEFINECAVALFLLIVGVALLTESLSTLIIRMSMMSKIIEIIQTFQWDGILGTLLWGDTLTDIADQLYYKALAQTFAAVADGILMIAGALFVISLVDPERMASSLDTLKEIANIMFSMVFVIELIGTIFEKIEQWGITKSEDGVLGKIFGFLGMSPDTFMVTAKYAGMAAMISTISTAFLKAAFSLLLLSTIEPDALYRSMNVITGIGIIIMTMYAVMSLLTGNSAAAGMFSSVKSGSVLNILKGYKKSSAGSFASESTGALKGAAAILLIAMAIKKVAKSVVMLADVPEDDLWRSVGAIAILAATITAIMYFSTGLSKWASKTEGTDNTIIAVARMVSSMGWAILLIAGALVLLTKLGDPTKLMESSKWLGICFAALSGMVVAVMLLSKVIKPEQTATIGIVAGLVMALSVSILAIAGALVLVSRVADPANLEEASKTLGRIFLAFAALILASAYIKPSQVMAVAGALALMNISTLALIPLLLTAMKIDDNAMEHLKKIFIGLGIAMSAFMAVAAVMANNPEVAGPMVGYLFGIIGALALLAVDATILSVGILLISVAFENFVNSLKMLENVDGEKIKNNMVQIASFIPEMFKVVTASLIDAFNTILAQPFDFTLLMTNILIGIVNAITTALPDIIESLKTAFISLLEALKVLVPLALDFVNFFGIELTKAVISGTIQITFALFEGFVDGMEQILPKVPEVVNKFADVLIANLDDILKAFDRLIEPLAEIVDHAITGVIAVLERSSGSIRKLVSTLFTLILDLANDFGVILTEKVTEGTIRILFAVVQGLIEGLAEAIPDLIDALFKAVVDVCNGIADALDENGDEIIKAVDRLMNSIADFIWKIVVKWGQEGGIFFEGGLQIVAGITRGITSRLKMVKEAAFSLGDYVKNGFCKVLRIESPSKVFEQFGKYISEGLLNGLNSMKDKVFENFGSFAEGIMNQFGINLDGGLGGALESLIGGLMGGINVDIIPNLDLTNLNGQISDLTNLFGEQQLQGMVGLDGFNTGDISLGNDSVTLNNGLDALNGKMDQLINVEKFNSQKDTDVNVFLEGDTSKFFKAIRKENTKRTRATGYNPLKAAKA